MVQPVISPETVRAGFVDPTVNLTLILTLLTSFAGLIWWVGQLYSRIGACEKANTSLKTDTEAKLKDIEGRLLIKKVGLQTLSDALTASRMDMVQHYTPVRYMEAVDHKLDTIFQANSEMKATQASQGATLEAIQATLRRLEKHP